MNKKYCDECGKRIENGLHLFKDKFNLFGILFPSVWINKDFCSKECLVKFVERELK